MLSAPEPPDGHSPSPPPVALPLKFSTSTIGSPQSADLSRTAPAEYLNTYGPNIAGNSHDSTQQQNSHTNGHPSTDQHHVPSQGATAHHNGAMGHSSFSQVTTGNGPSKEPAQTNAKSRSRRPSHTASTSSTDIVQRDSSDSPEVRRKVLKMDELDGAGAGRPNPSVPIPIRGQLNMLKSILHHLLMYTCILVQPLYCMSFYTTGLHVCVVLFDIIVGSKHKKTRTRRDSKVSTNGDATSLAKLPPVDSDEEAEVVKLTSNKVTTSGGSDPFGREQLFTPMVNREMLCSLVRRSFDQTEEQQAMFEQSLRHEYGRRSKGEVCV